MPFDSTMALQSMEVRTDNQLAEHAGCEDDEHRDGHGEHERGSDDGNA